ncbi:MAG TPA: hypothetical protein ENK59_02400 [Thioploca sp.]|nr:hypothetical protein [Thioploca sp.]
MKQILICFLTILIGCTSNQIKTKDELANLHFIDVDTFDQNLSKSMSIGNDTITVSMIGKVSVNKIPERLGKWLSVINAKMGKVDFKSTTPPKPINERNTGSLAVTAVLGLLPSTYDFLKDKFFYSSAEKYDAILYYQADTGLLEKVIFVKK